MTVYFTELCTENEYDWVMLRDEDDYGELLLEHTGCDSEAVPVSFNTTGPNFIARFSTDHGTSAEGFQAYFNCTDLPYGMSTFQTFNVETSLHMVEHYFFFPDTTLPTEGTIEHTTVAR